jgi:16S rRNA (guanine966-N2)-methyltransferase
MGTLRVVAGDLRGRRIRVLPGSLVRPTPDKVREALFDILGPYLSGLAVLDVCAGSGALGFEALSRGASSATFIEADRRVLGVLRENAEHLGVGSRCRILGGRAETLLAARRAGGPFDLVMGDPPYAGGLGGPILKALVAVPGTLADAARVVLERDSRSAPAIAPGASLRLVRTARYGRNCLDFYAFDGSLRATPV